MAKRKPKITPYKFEELSEKTIAKYCTMECGLNGVRVHRNNTGKARSFDGKRVITFGLCRGSSDYIGWLPVTVTPDMVGKTVAVFVAMETKDAKGKTTEHQDNFIDQVNEAGGIAFVARKPQDVMDALEEWRNKG